MENRRPSRSEVAGSLIWNHGIENIRMCVEGIPNLLIANEHLKKGGRILLNHNHPGSVDPGVVLRTVYDYLVDFQSLGYPASSKFLDGRMPVFGWVIGYLKAEGLLNEAWPIVQDSDQVKLRQVLRERAKKIRSIKRVDIKNAIYDFAKRQEPEFEELEINGNGDTQEFKGLNQEMLSAAVYFFKNAPSPIVPIGQEGTRNIQKHLFKKNRGIKRPRNGAALLFGMVPENTLLLPFAIEGSENFHQKGQKIPPVNPFAKIRVHVGIPRTFEEVVGVANYLNFASSNRIRSLSNAIMLEVAVQLPDRYWGVYKSTIERIMKETQTPYPIRALDKIRSLYSDQKAISRYHTFFKRLEGMYGKGI